MLKSSKQLNVRHAIQRWYRQQGRALPWRGISNPYRILISEVMLQQTQVSRVLVKYPEFLRRFPTLRSLANAKQRDVVLAWRGMGYNNRAVRLHKFAHAVMQDHRGRIPRDFDSLSALPGIGKYTANALLSSAFGRQLPVVDVNVQRVLSRLFGRMKTTSEMRSTNEIWRLAESLVPKRNAYDWNQALMDLGATICTARNPKCDECPVAVFCSSRISMRAELGTRSKSKRSLDGIPNRFYRGRVVEYLRDSGKSVRFDDLGPKVHANFSSKHHVWLRTLLSGLEKDGLIRVRRNGKLPATRISLA